MQLTISTSICFSDYDRSVPWSWLTALPSPSYFYRTVLSSCISYTFWDGYIHQSKILFHALLRCSFWQKLEKGSFLSSWSWFYPLLLWLLINHCVIKWPSLRIGLYFLFTATIEASQTLDDLCRLKSRIEGTWFEYQPYSFDLHKVAELRNLVVAFTPSTLLESTKAKIAEKLEELFHGQVKRLLYACLLTCPWFAASHSEVSAQAKHNLLFVVFVMNNEQFFSLATPHEKEMCETLNEVNGI